MRRDGRKLDHRTLEEMRILAVRRMQEGESPAKVAASFGLHQTWACKIRAQVRGRGQGLRVLASRQGTGRPRKRTVAQER
ncbi:MAG: IS630 family transposase, partial [Candidatus Accumulibacter sp.]|nr:IS630 family transposase [Accumulibacter sp.]